MNKPPNDSDKPQKILDIFDSLLGNSGQVKLTEDQVAVLLDTLANAADAAFVARFPAVLASCDRSGRLPDFRAMCSRFPEFSPRRQNLEKLLMASAASLNLHGLVLPEKLAEFVTFLKPRYGDLLKAGEFQLSNGLYFSLHDLEIFPEDHPPPPPKSRVIEKRTEAPTSRTLDIYLNRLFSPKQKELILKRRDGKAFTKTEREYFSRTVRKKLQAVADEELAALARKLIRK